MKHVVRVLAHWGLLIHIYVSMAGFTLVLLFAVTGLTLNHQDFGWAEPDTATSTLSVPSDLVQEADASALARHFNAQIGVVSPLTDFHADPQQIQLTFAAPGHRTVVMVDRSQNSAMVETVNRGLLGKLDDLHKGFDSGWVWYWIIDISALLLIISSLTGMVTLLALRARRKSGFLIGGLGVVSLLVVYFLWVPQ